MRARQEWGRRGTKKLYIQTPPLFYLCSRGIPSVTHTQKNNQEIRFKNPNYHQGQSQSLKDLDISTSVYQFGLFFSRGSVFVKMNFLTFTSQQKKAKVMGLAFFFFLTTSFSLRWLIFIWRVGVVKQSSSKWKFRSPSASFSMFYRWN